MPLLTDINDHVPDEEQLSLNIELIDLETYNDGTTTEGWINFKIAALKGGRKLIQDGGTIHDSDLKQLVELLSNLSKEPTEFEPMEPNFWITIDCDQWGKYDLTCMVNYGHTFRDIYANSAIGIRLQTNKSALEKFGKQLKRDREELTKGLDFAGWVDRPVPK